MASRMDKYLDENSELVNSIPEEDRPYFSRTKKNQKLYKEVSNLDLVDFDLNSNASVIGNNSSNIDLNDIKNMLNDKYKELPKNKKIGDDTEEIELPKINLDETREYDINSILEKAKSQKEVNYEDERLNKLHSTQVDILKDLDIFDKEEEIEEEDLNLEDDEVKEVVKVEVASESSKKKLEDLINTINSNDIIDDLNDTESSLDPLDILSDLRGDDENTRVMGALEVDKFESDDDSEDKIIEADDEELEATQKEKVKEDIIVKSEKSEVKAKKELIDTNTFTESSFDDFDDLKDDIKATRYLLIILVVVIILIFVIGCVALANKMLGWGLF